MAAVPCPGWERSQVSTCPRRGFAAGFGWGLLGAGLAALALGSSPLFPGSAGPSSQPLPCGLFRVVVAAVPVGTTTAGGSSVRDERLGAAGLRR